METNDHDQNQNNYDAFSEGLPSMQELKLPPNLKMDLNKISECPEEASEKNIQSPWPCPAPIPQNNFTGVDPHKPLRRRTALTKEDFQERESLSEIIPSTHSNPKFIKDLGSAQKLFDSRIKKKVVEQENSDSLQLSPSRKIGKLETNINKEIEEKILNQPEFRSTFCHVLSNFSSQITFGGRNITKQLIDPLMQKQNETKSKFAREIDNETMMNKQIIPAKISTSPKLQNRSMGNPNHFRLNNSFDQNIPAGSNMLTGYESSCRLKIHNLSKTSLGHEQSENLSKNLPKTENSYMNYDKMFGSGFEAKDSQFKLRDINNSSSKLEIVRTSLLTSGVSEPNIAKPMTRLNVMTNQVGKSPRKEQESLIKSKRQYTNILNEKQETTKFMPINSLMNEYLGVFSEEKQPHIGNFCHKDTLANGKNLNTIKENMTEYEKKIGNFVQESSYQLLKESPSLYDDFELTNIAQDISYHQKIDTALTSRSRQVSVF